MALNKIRLNGVDETSRILNQWLDQVEQSIAKIDKQVTSLGNGTLISSNILSNNLLGTSKIAQAQGSMLPTITGSFSYVSDGTSLTWSWTSLKIRAPYLDHNHSPVIFTVANGTQAITGLSNSTTYFFYPYYDIPTRSLLWINTGTAGTPTYAFTARSESAAQLQQIDSRIPLSSGGISGATTAGAAGGGSGIGGSGCLHPEQWVFTKRERLRAKYLKVGDSLLCAEGWTKIVFIGHPPAETKLTIEFLNGKVLEVSPSHKFIGRDEKIEAAKLSCSDLVRTKTGYTLAKSITSNDESFEAIMLSCEPYHSYFVEGILCENFVLNGK